MTGGGGCSRIFGRTQSYARESSGGPSWLESADPTADGPPPTEESGGGQEPPNGVVRCPPRLRPPADARNQMPAVSHPNSSGEETEKVPEGLIGTPAGVKTEGRGEPVTGATEAGASTLRATARPFHTTSGCPDLCYCAAAAPAPMENVVAPRRAQWQVDPVSGTLPVLCGGAREQSPRVSRLCFSSTGSERYFAQESPLGY